MNAKQYSKLDNLLNAAHKQAADVKHDMSALVKHTGGEDGAYAYADAGTIRKEMASIIDFINEAKRELRAIVEGKLPK